MYLSIHYMNFRQLLCRNKIVIEFSPVYFVDLYVKSRYLDLATSHKFPNRIRIFFESSLDNFCIKLDDMELEEMFDFYIRHTSSFLTWNPYLRLFFYNVDYFSILIATQLHPTLYPALILDSANMPETLCLLHFDSSIGN